MEERKTWVSSGGSMAAIVTVMSHYISPDSRLRQTFKEIGEQNRNRIIGGGVGHTQLRFALRNCSS